MSLYVLLRCPLIFFDVLMSCARRFNGFNDFFMICAFFFDVLLFSFVFEHFVHDVSMIALISL